MKRLALALALSTALTNPALAGIAIINGGGTGGTIATGSVTGSANITSTASTVDVPVGSLVFIGLTDLASTNGYTACTDSAGNTYTANLAAKLSPGVQMTAWTWLVTTIDAPIGATWSCTNAHTSSKGLRVAAFSGPAASPLDAASATATNGTGTVMSIGPTGTLACPGGGANCEALITVFGNRSITAQTAQTGSFTYMGCDGSNGADICMSYEIVSAATAQSFTSTNGNSDVWSMALEAFKAATTGATGHSLGALGAGN